MIRLLKILELFERRNAPAKLLEFRKAQTELERASAEDDAIRHLWRVPDGHPWMRDWVKEAEPLLAYARQLDLDDDAIVCWLKGVPGADAILEWAPDKFEVIEITGTYNFHDRLTDEILNQEGWVASTTPKVRNPTTKQAEYAEDDRMDTADDILDDWAKRIESALRGKQRLNYGEGSTLLVSCRGVGGDLQNIRREFSDVLGKVPPDAMKNCFRQTILLGWHSSCFHRF